MTATEARDEVTPRQPLRIAHLADTHLGYSAFGRADPESGRNQRAVDIERAFEVAVTGILNAGVDVVIHAGDVFHHTRPSWSTLAHFVRQMRRLEMVGIPIVVIAGNHDTPRLRTTGSVYGLLELALPGTAFIAGYETVELPLAHLGLMVHGVPHGSLVNPDPPAILPRAGWWNVAVAHGVVPGHVFRTRHEPGEVELRGNILDTSFDYIALGHVHIREQVGINAWYCGSTERTSWGDQSANPGWALVTLDKPGGVPQVAFHDVPARPMDTLSPIDGADRDARELATIILERAAALDRPDAMLRVELQQTPRPLFRETEAIVRRETGEAAWLIRLTAPGDLLDPLGREAVSGLADLHPLTLFDDFVRQREDAGVYDTDFAERFRIRGRAALEAALRKSQEAAASEGAA